MRASLVVCSLAFGLTGCFPEVIAVSDGSGLVGGAGGGADGADGGAGTGDVTDDTGASDGTGGDDGGGTDGGDAGTDAGDAGTDGGDDGGEPNTAPSCTITAPTSGLALPFTDSLTLEATAEDAEDGSLMADSVVWYSDMEADVLGTGTTSVPVFTVSGEHVITCVATDSGGLTGVDSILVTIISPLVEITSPDDGDQFDEGDEVRFKAKAVDLEDGDLTDGSVIWTSDRSGDFGEGTNFRYDSLRRGDHVITVTATDADGNTATDEIEIEIQED